LHRLDTQTSGLIVAARNPSAFTALHDALRAGRWTKRYLAVVNGVVLQDSGSIELELHHDRKRRGRVVAGGGAASSHLRRTRFAVLERGTAYTLLELEISRAFRHQIRAHLSAIGHPVAGDGVYGAGRIDALGARHALHASYVACDAARGIPAFEVEDAVPAELAALVRDAGTPRR
jgi:23S rRNA pseudouridine1911/1915/1917 synthase